MPEQDDQEQLTAAVRTTVRVPGESDGMRLDMFLSQTLPHHSRAFYQRATKDGLVHLNDQPCRQSDKVRTDDQIRIRWPVEAPLELTPEQVQFDILTEDDDLLVINKPAGLVVHPAKGNLTGTLVHGLLYHDRERFQKLIDDEMRPGIVHRLDKDTSGAMVVAKTHAARVALKKAFAERRVEKTYLALVLGEFGAVTGVVRKPIGRHPRNRMKMAALQEGGKLAVTHYRVLAAQQNVTLVQVRIETGRTHQIRVHFADLKHPVLGDRLYGGRQNDAPLKPDRQMLHAWKLAFPHPCTGITRQYMAGLPDDFREILEALGLPRIGRP